MTVMDRLRYGLRILKLFRTSDGHAAVNTTTFIAGSAVVLHFWGHA
jgi:hypothetical protein